MRKVTRIIIEYDDGTKTEWNSIPSEPVPYKDPPMPWDPLSTCPKCGIDIHRVMGYVCNNIPCPVGLGGPIC